MKLWHGRRTHRPFVHRGVVLAPAQNDAADFVVSDGPDDPLANPPHLSIVGHLYGTPRSPGYALIGETACTRHFGVPVAKTGEGFELLGRFTRPYFFTTCGHD